MKPSEIIGAEEQNWDPPVEGLIVVGGVESVVDLSLENEPKVSADLMIRNARIVEAGASELHAELEKIDPIDSLKKFNRNVADLRDRGL